MSDIYASLAATALSMLTKYGSALTLQTVTTAGTYNPVTGVTTGATTTTNTVYGVAQKITTQLRQTFGDIQAGDRIYIIDASQTPTLADKLIIDSNPWAIVQIEAIKPAATAVAYMVQVRS